MPTAERDLPGQSPPSSPKENLGRAGDPSCEAKGVGTSVPPSHWGIRFQIALVLGEGQSGRSVAGGAIGEPTGGGATDVSADIRSNRVFMS